MSLLQASGNVFPRVVRKLKVSLISVQSKQAIRNEEKGKDAEYPREDNAL